MLKSSAWILEQCQKQRLLEPFLDKPVRQGVISYGPGPYGYDIRLDGNYRVLRSGVANLDPFTLREEDFENRSDNPIPIPAGHFILGRSLEYFRMPRKILGLVFGKSTYARIGVLVNVTPLEPEWSGFLTMAIANTSSATVLIHPRQGIAQVIFLESEDLPLFSYRDLAGKYNDQADITIAKVQEGAT